MVMVAAPAARMRAGNLQPPNSMEVEELALTEGRSKQQQQQTGLPEKISTISYALDAYSHPLVVESKAAFNALLIVPLVIWWLAVVAGMWVYEGLPKGQRIYHSMLWFDSKILRPAGPLVPFVIVILRALVHGADYVYRHGRSSSAAVARAAAAKAARGAAGKQALVKLGSLIGWCLAIYVAMAVARVGIYLTHWFLLTNRFLEFHIVSDHIFLAASMLICLHTEIICLMSDITRAIQRWGSPANCRASAAAGIPGLDILLTLLFVVALFLYLFTTADMFYTAKYYHFPMESFFTTVVVFVVFQLPMLVWLKWSWRFRADE